MVSPLDNLRLAVQSSHQDKLTCYQLQCQHTDMKVDEIDPLIKLSARKQIHSQDFDLLLQKDHKDIFKKYIYSVCLYLFLLNNLLNF